MTQNAFFDDRWLKLQRDYWNGLADIGRQAMGGTTSDASSDRASTAPWLAAMDQWWKAVAPAAGDPAKDFMRHLIDQGQVYFGMVEQLTKGLGSAGDTASAWDALNKTFEAMQQGFSGTGSAGNDALKRMFGFWEMPLDNWQRMVSSLSPMMPGDLLRNMPHGEMGGPFKEGLERMLSAPGLGYTREEQAQYQHLIRAGMDYQKAFQEYSAFFNQLGIKALQALREQLQQKSEAGETIDSARALYDGWVGCCEAVYANEVATPEYARLHGRLVNAQMALKQRLSVMVDESLGALNMPTRGELRTLQDRLQETRRENKRLQQELELIKRKVAGLPSGPAASTATRRSASTTTTKKTSPRKKTAAKSS
jgi:class III poly(R)-hydroxyalkanoic acid synthase PhaE subunit